MPEGHQSPEYDDVDDVDRLFAHLERAPAPTDFTGRVLASTVARAPSDRAAWAWPWLLTGLAALGVLSLAGYQLGASLAAGDGLELLAAIMADAGLLSTAPGDVLAAVGEVVPWTLLGLAAAGAALLTLAAGRVVSPAPLRAQP
ncbi:MAG TPA: hypothetical protein VF937_12065 [Chloroflexota bacterium]